MELYQHPLSPYAQKIRIALREKGLAFADGRMKRQFRDHRLEWLARSGGVQVLLDGLAAGNVRFTETSPFAE
ncbi:hypothetical protein GCM10019059_10040 [Camelimonas fluminis]|uniref:Glutathione S-transferase N-terminal domain-containing protein n=1 Tax=Camelimonas fluminis TaxID=1576911 RepID=A0ABV7UDS3_9HYPH|nr:glutathione S-transferase N-terminal domain-containing protein [Camelimonas fluminis]GHE52598.1 hypothetical protein GCM10019059_10040 [Camelimonas fluminis]